MGQQINKVTKRRRRADYLKRKKEQAKLGGIVKKSVAKKETSAKKEPAKKVATKKVAAKKAPAKKVAKKVDDETAQAPQSEAAE
jgi:hypothetical protein